MEGVFNSTNGGHDVRVSAKIPRRRFTAEYKLKIVREADACSKAGELGALLRREGLYSSNLVTWRRARDRGELINAPKRGRRPKPVDPSAKRMAELERKLAKAEARAERAEALVELQKKVAALLGRPFPSEES
jgi:transposase-like protein